MLGLEPVVRAYLSWVARREGRLTIQALETVWPIAVGRVWAQHTRPHALRGGKLEVAVPDSVWQSELRFQRQRILERLSRFWPERVAPITAILFSVGEVGPRAAAPAGRAKKRERIPLTELQEQSAAGIRDPALRSLVTRVIERDDGRLREPSTPVRPVRGDAVEE